MTECLISDILSVYVDSQCIERGLRRSLLAQPPLRNQNHLGGFYQLFSWKAEMTIGCHLWRSTLFPQMLVR